MDYFLFRVKCPTEFRDIFIAELAEIGFDMMEEKEDCIEAFAEESKRSQLNTKELVNKYKGLEGVEFEFGYVENQNWNENWEKNYKPIVVDETCYIRADFHPSADYPIELIITPRMSFGTGHHATTYLMVSYMLKNDFVDKTVLDAGTGTGVLSILASKLNAKSITAYDVSALCIENTVDNMRTNNVSDIKTLTGTIADFNLNERFDYILANINRNAIIEEMAQFVKLVNKNTKLVFSGFYEKDLPLIMDAARKEGITPLETFTREEWCCAVFTH